MTSVIKGALKKHPGILSLLIFLVIFFVYLIGVPFLDVVELKTIDLRFKTRSRISPGPELVLAVIDEKSLAREGKWIWPRSKMADLVTRISNAGAKVIGFDIGFLEPDEKSVVRTVEEIEDKISEFKIDEINLNHYLHHLKKQTDYDQRLADAIRNASCKVVLGYFFQMESDALDNMLEDDIRYHQNNTRGSAYKTVTYRSVKAEKVPLIEASVPQSNIEKIAEASPLAGYFNMIPDTDGVVRWIPGVIRFQDTLYAPLSLMLLSAFWDVSLSVTVAEYGIEEIKIGEVSLPTDEFGRILINYRGEEKSFPHISITDILNGTIDNAALKNKIVLVGATAVGIYDVRVTPFGTLFPGLEIHANIVDSVLSKEFMQQPGWAKIFDILAMVFAGLLLGLGLPRLSVISGVAATLLLGVGYVVLCQLLFSRSGWVLNLVYPLSMIILSYLSITIYRYFSETKQKRFIKDAFSTYLAPSVVNQLIETPDRFKLGGEKREITAFFSDVQSFTSISERLSPEELVELLNEFLTEMTNVILEHEGTVDKFEGDAIIAFFGAPNDIPNHAEVACMSCIEMQKRLVVLREKWKMQGKPELKMRIGLCSGPAVVGNMGSKNRMDYTMMGDTVNTAARLEGINKVYGIYTMVSESTFKAAGDWIVVREIDSVNVVGKSDPIKIYQLLGYPEDLDDGIHSMLDHYAAGLAAYRLQDWNRAIQSFSAALKIDPEDGPSRTMMSRCNEFQHNSPGEDWNGNYAMTSK